MTTESFRKDVARKLADLQADEDETKSVAFPKDLTSSDRKYIHKIAESFRLPTVSSGVGDERYIEVFKVAPEGHEARRPPPGSWNTPSFLIPMTQRASLQRVLATAPPATGKMALSSVRPYSHKKFGNQPKLAPLAPGDCAEGYWPDDETWLPIAITSVACDGSFTITWEDGCESEVPADYVRRSAEDCGAPESSLALLEKALGKIRARPNYAKLAKREDLPAFVQRKVVEEGIRKNQVVLLSGETGCGKSTQVPQTIIDACPGAKVLVMQPRKLAAVTLAQRVSEERCQPVGVDVGYQVPFGGKAPNARLVFCTLGVFRKRLLNDPTLAGITHVVFDEVHERDKLADFNMIFMRDLLAQRPDLKLILMSATLQLETFEQYFEGALRLDIPGRVFPVSNLYLDEVVATLWKQQNFRTWLGPGVLCGGIDIPAGAEGDWNERAWKTIVFQHPKAEDRETLWGLREKGLEPQMMAPMSKQRLLDGLRKHDCLQQSSLAFDFPIIEALLLHIDRMHKDQMKSKAADEEEKPPGTVLVFLPGWGDIDQLQKRLVTNFDAKRFSILALHSQVSPEQQREIFEPPPTGVRKIVLTTNIAEASITVDGTEFVIDCGRAKEVSYDPYLKVGTLTTSWISQASAKQRAGRAGRTQGGLCFHLMCRDRYSKLDEFLPPELLRSPLEDSALTAKLMLLQMGSSEKVSTFLMKAPSPPEPIAVENSLQLLTDLGAFTAGEQLTALGEHLTTSSLPPRLAKVVIWGVLFGCLEDTLAVVAATGGFTRDPFRFAGIPREDAQAIRRKLAGPHNSDHSCLLNVMRGFTDASNQQAYCDRNHLVAATMRNIRDQQTKIFTELSENKSESLAARRSGSFELLTAVLLAGIFPNIARRRGKSDSLDAQNGKVEVRPHGQSAYIPDKPDEWVFFQEMTQVESSYRIKQVSPVDHLTLLLFGGEGPLVIENSKGKGKGKAETHVSLLDGWVKFTIEAGLAEQIQKLRASLQTVFQSFCQKPTEIPPRAHLVFLDAVADLICGTSSGSGEIEVMEIEDDEPRGVKRPAPWAAGPAATRPRPNGPKGQPFKGGGFKGKGKGAPKGGFRPWE